MDNKQDNKRNEQDKQNEQNNASLSNFIAALENPDNGFVKNVPDAHEQIDAMKKFANGKMSYSEMRSLCG